MNHARTALLKIRSTARRQAYIATDVRSTVADIFDVWGHTTIPRWRCRETIWPQVEFGRAQPVEER